MTTVDSKLCCSCKETKPITEFTKSSKSKDGLQHKCKQCDRIRLHDAYVKNRENKIARAKAYNAAHKDERREYKKKYNKEYAANNLSRLREYHRSYQKANTDRYNAYSRNRRAIKKLAPGSHTIQDVTLLRELQRHRCAICKCSVKKQYHVDHIYPLFFGGSNGKENLQILCPTCNLSKNAKDPIQFMNQKGLLL